MEKEGEPGEELHGGELNHRLRHFENAHKGLLDTIVDAHGGVFLP